MRLCVLDASVVVKWYLDEPGSEAARALQETQLEIAAPHLLLLEVGNVLWKHVRRGGLDAPTAGRILDTLSDAPIQWHDDASLHREAFTIAESTGRTVYDCLYLTLAARRNCPLITADRKFFDAIQAGPYGPYSRWIENIS